MKSQGNYFLKHVQIYINYLEKNTNNNKNVILETTKHIHKEPNPNNNHKLQITYNIIQNKNKSKYIDINNEKGYKNNDLPRTVAKVSR